MNLRPVLRSVLEPVSRGPFERGLGGAVTPLTVFGSRLLYWNDPSDLGNTWQDSGRTTGAAVGSPVGSRLNKGTLGGYAAQSSAGSRPTLRQSNGYYDESDVTDDFLSIALNLSAYSAITVAYGVLKENDAAVGIATEFTTDVASNNGSFYFAAPNAATTFGFSLNGTTQARYDLLGFAAPQSRVLIASFDIGGTGIAAEIFPYVDGVLSQSGAVGADCGTGNFANSTLYEMMRGGGTSFPLFGGLYQRMIISGVITAGERAWLNTWMGAKQGKVL